jgi:hypothetical protein
MAPTPVPAAASGKTIPSRHELFDSLVGIVTSHANEHLMALINRLVAALLDISDPSIDARAVYQRVKSGNLLKHNSYAFFHVAASGLEQAVRKEIALLAPAPNGSRSTPAAALALVPFEEMDSRVAFGAISRPFEISYAEPLATLNVRLGFLLERDILRIGQNPFRPELFLIAINEAWCEFEPDQEAHKLILPLLRPNILFDFAPMFEALNLALMHNRTQPGSPESFHIRKTEHASAARAARASGQAALAQQLRQFLSSTEPATPEFDTEIPLIPDLPGMAQGSGGWRPSAAPGYRAAAPATNRGATAPPPAAVTVQAGAPLFDLLARLQQGLPEQPAHAPEALAVALPHNVFYLPRLKDGVPKGSLSRGDEGTIDLLSRIFETVFLDENIPQETRDLIHFLQIPVLKAALLDKDFFFEEAHPARRMIDLLSRMGWEQRKGPDDPLFQAMRRSVDRVGRDFDRKLDVFAEAVADLEASIEAAEAAADAAISEPIARALKQEKVTVAATSAKGAVALRVGSGELVAVVEAFLEDKWTAVLTVAYSVEGEKPGAVGNATRAMDELIWSVKPKVTQEQRKDLIAKLPALLSALNKWLDVIKWQDAARLQFFAELAECHASIVRAPLALSPERQLEIALEVAQQDAIRRIEKEHAAAACEEAQLDEAVIAVDGLERGMWLEFTGPDQSVRKVKLAWVSPLRTLYIFSTAARQEAFSISAEKLADAYRRHTVRLIQTGGVVARALSQAMAQAAVNDPAIDPPHPAVA